MYEVRNPRSGKVYRYGRANREKAYALAARLGVEVVTSAYAPPVLCVCGRPEDDHEAYDCHRDYAMAPWGDEPVRPAFRRFAAPA